MWETDFPRKKFRNNSDPERKKEENVRDSNLIIMRKIKGTRSKMLHPKSNWEDYCCHA